MINKTNHTGNYPAQIPQVYTLPAQGVTGVSLPPTQFWKPESVYQAANPGLYNVSQGPNADDDKIRDVMRNRIFQSVPVIEGYKIYTVAPQQNGERIVTLIKENSNQRIAYTLPPLPSQPLLRSNNN